MLEELEAALFAAGMDDEDGHAIESDDEAVPPIWISYEADSAGALWNFLLVEEDQSMGIHNPAYAKALLENPIDAVTGVK